MTVTQAVYRLMDKLPEREISGWELFEIVKGYTGKNTYPSTLLQIVRDYADITGADFICIDRKKSIYKYIPCIRLGNAIIDRR